MEEKKILNKNFQDFKSQNKEEILWFKDKEKEKEIKEESKKK